MPNKDRDGNENDVPYEIVAALFFAKWCGHCVKFKPTWNNFIKDIDGTKIRYMEIDCSVNERTEKSSDKISDKDTIKNYEAGGYPTVLLFIKKKKEDPYKIIKYGGDRTVETLKEFVESAGTKHSEETKNGGADEENSFEEYAEEGGDFNYDLCGGGNKCEFKGGKRADKDLEYYKMKYFKYKAKYIKLRSKYNL